MTAPRCPTCNISLSTGVDSPVFPFCSQRCKSVDLGNWLNGRYVIDAGAVEDEPLRQDIPEDYDFNE